MRDPQFQGVPEQGRHGGVDLAAGEELEARAVRALTDDADELPHDRFGVVHELGEPAVHLLEGRQGEFRPDRCPRLIVDWLARSLFFRCFLGVADAFQEPLGG